MIFFYCSTKYLAFSKLLGYNKNRMKLILSSKMLYQLPLYHQMRKCFFTGNFAMMPNVMWLTALTKGHILLYEHRIAWIDLFMKVSLWDKRSCSYDK